MALTGRFEFRKALTGKIVLRIEEEVSTFWSRFGEHRTKRRWRDATLMDLSAPEMRRLIDLRFRPQLLTQVDVDRPGSSAERAYPMTAPQQPVTLVRSEPGSPRP